METKATDHSSDFTQPGKYTAEMIYEISLFNPRDREQLAAFIKRHPTAGTVKELSFLLNIPTSYLLEAQKIAGVKLVKEIDRLYQFVKDNSDMTAGEIARIVLYTPARVMQVAKELGITLPRPVDKNTMKEKLKGVTKRTARVGFKDAYTQSESPYGIASKLHGITTK
jgi:hypothetical protein